MMRCSILDTLRRRQIKSMLKDHSPPKVVAVYLSKRPMPSLARLWQQSLSPLLTEDTGLWDGTSVSVRKLQINVFSDLAIPFLQNVVYRNNQASTNLVNETLFVKAK